MHKYNHISDLLSVDKTIQKDEIKKVFEPYTENIQVDGMEFEALCILLNLTYKHQKIKDYFESKLAKKVIKNESIFVKILEQINWLHTHNCKFPEPRVSKERLVGQVAIPQDNLLASHFYDRQFGWANNAADYRKAKTISTNFLWNEETVCLGQLLISLPKAWAKALSKLGLTQKKLKYLLEHNQIALPTEYFPKEIDPHFKQLRFLNEFEYISITPVVSFAVQRQIQLLASKKLLPNHSIKFSYPQPCCLGNLMGATGGNYKVLTGLPLISDKNYTLHQSRVKASYSEYKLFNSYIFKSKDFIFALKVICNEHLSITRHKRKLDRKNALKTIREYVFLWLEPLFEWRTYLKSNPQQFDSENTNIEYLLATADHQDLPKLTKKLNIVFHECLQLNKQLKQYSFHAKLLMPVLSQIKTILKSWDSSEVIDEHQTSFAYLHFKGLRLSSANALPCPYLVGIPSLVGIWGFLHKFERNCIEMGIIDFSVSSFALYIGSFSLHDEPKLPEPNDIKLKNKTHYTFARPGLRNGVQCDMQFDLVVKIKKSHHWKDNLKIEHLMAAKPSSFCGGTLHPPSIKKDWLILHNNINSIFSKIKTLPAHGCWVYPTSIPFKTETELIERLTQDKNLRLVFRGYLFLDDPSERQNSYEDKHVFAEPALGLSECVNPIETRIAGINHFKENAFWQPNTKSLSTLISGEKVEDEFV